MALVLTHREGDEVEFYQGGLIGRLRIEHIYRGSDREKTVALNFNRAGYRIGRNSVMPETWLEIGIANSDKKNEFGKVKLYYNAHPTVDIRRVK